LQGGLFHVQLKGPGNVAISADEEPMVMHVSPQTGPVHTNPARTVCWSGGLKISVAHDVKAKSLVGRDSGAESQMVLEGTGYVMIECNQKKKSN